VPTWPVAALSLVAGFAVADLTGVRPLGGLVLLAAVAWCFVRWRARAGTGRAVALAAFYAAAFAASHALADVLGTWGAVATVAALTGAAAWLLADRATSDARRPRRRSPSSHPGRA
jgi:hypothetical protein